ncbi:MAG TPA: efflux RND transporter periplasmic adaptor subunit [Desulfotignum sp.]|nr:efflux RND transporter periplasmic adaptor subunit [Desulfotignum sp.]
MKHIISVLLFLSTAFIACQNDSIPPGVTRDTSLPDKGFAHTAQVETRQVPKTHEAVGTIQPLTESIIESRISGQVMAVSVSPGDRVLKGQTLVVLDNRQVTARFNQAREEKTLAENRLGQALKGVDEDRAELEQARAAYERSQALFDKHIVPSQQLEIDRAAFLTASARLAKTQEAVTGAKTDIRRAEQVVAEAQIALEYATVTAPESGVLLQRLVDPGDQAIPGRPLLKIQTSGYLQLEAHVREGLIHHIVRDKAYDVKIQTVDKTVTAVIREITPWADPDTRTFLVKASLSEDPGIFPGMFGRLIIPVGHETIRVVPKTAVTRVGQLEMVHVKTADNRFRSVYIKTGQVLGTDIEVLSGLTGDETLGW